MLMHADDTDNTDFKKQGLIYEDLTFKIRRILFLAHNELGPYAREKQYNDVVARLCKENAMGYEQEVRIGNSVISLTE